MMRKGWGDIGKTVAWTVGSEDLKKVLDRLGIEIVREDDLGELWSRCPFHDDRKPSWSISTEKPGNPSNCFSCGARARTLIGLIAMKRGGDMEDAKRWLNKYVDTTTYVLRGESIIVVPKVESDAEMDEAILSTFVPCRHPYMLKRGFSTDFLDREGILYDRNTRRVIFPVRNSKRLLVGVVGRTVVGAEPKYYFYNNFPKSRYLMGEHRIKDDEAVHIVEGAVDYLRCIQHGFTQTVALMGCQVSAKQTEKLRKMGAKRFTLMLDNDEAGMDGNRALKNALRGVAPLRLPRYPDGLKDPGDATKEQLRGMISGAELVWVGPKKVDKRKQV